MILPGFRNTISKVAEMDNLARLKQPASRVRPLPDSVANQIAAGEVVERPASVIKELVENSLDSGADSLYISFRNGGKSYMEVSDNGGGMTGDDALLSLERHATSKISEAEDLKSITTLGFRGEALPSIASVSRLTLTTCVTGAPSGVEVTIDGGKLRNVRDAAPAPGTRIMVRDLFFNTPARRKFLRSEGVEAGHCLEAVTRQALARPDVAFTVVRDGKITQDSAGQAGDGGMEARISSIFGERAMAELTRVEHEAGGMSLTGYISRPGLSRKSRSMQYVYVNGRYLRDRLISHAVAEGYRSLLPRGRHPALFLFIAMPYDRVDVNVSPTKTEARFADTGGVIRLVRDGVFNALRGVKHSGEEKRRFDAVSLPPFVEYADETGAKKEDTESADKPTGRPMVVRPRFSEPVAMIEGEPPHAALEEEMAGGLQLSSFDEAISGDFKALGQVFGAFILVEHGNRLLLIDQHTAHERILYEKLTLRYREGRVDTQELLFPVEIELSAPDSEKLKRAANEFEKLGFTIDEFGEGFYALRSAPSLLAGADLRSLVMDIIDRISVPGFDQIAEDAINIMACRGAVKAGQALDKKEMESLVNRLGGLVLPYTCPHGRPIALAINKEDVLKGFLRK